MFKFSCAIKNVFSTTKLILSTIICAGVEQIRSRRLRNVSVYIAFSPNLSINSQAY